MKTFDYDAGKAHRAARTGEFEHREYLKPYVEEYFREFCIWYLAEQNFDLDISLRDTDMSIEDVLDAVIESDREYDRMNFAVSLTQIPSFDLLWLFFSYCALTIQLDKESDLTE